MSIESPGQYFNSIEDPRCSGKVEHRLLDVLVIAMSAVIACAESWDDIALYGRSKLALLRTFLELANGIPSHDTFRRVFMLIDPDAFEAGFTAWVGSLVANFEREVVAIEGKTIRRSFDHGREQSPLHVVSAWASEQGLVLGQRCVDGKSNEITAIPELLDQLALENSIVTLDAMGCQTAIAEKILARGGDYLLTLKGNHSLAHAAVVDHFDQRCFCRGAPSRADCDAFDDTHGAWSGAGCSPAPMLRPSKPWSAGRDCAPCWRWRASAASTARPRWRLKSATFCRAALTVRPSWAGRSARIGRWRTTRHATSQGSGVESKQAVLSARLRWSRRRHARA